MSRVTARLRWSLIFRGGLVAFFFPAAIIAQSHLLAPQDLRCESLPAPLAVNSQHPLLSWQLHATAMTRGVYQTAAQVIVAATREDVLYQRGTVWNSGQEPQSTTSIAAKPTLAPETTYWWAVRTWDENHRPSQWSAPVRFITAPTTWSAFWIASPSSTEEDGSSLDGSHPMPVFHRVFELKEPPVEAVLSIAGLGQYDAQLNDAAIARDGLYQAWTDYRKTVTYDTFDVTSRIHVGANTMRVLLGNGMYNVQRTKGRYTKFEGSFGVPKLTADLRIRYADGRVEHIMTDTQWQTAPGPVRFSSTYGGEDFDAIAERISSAAWVPAILTTPAGGVMIPSIATAVTEQEHYPARLISTKTNATVYDLGRNIAGWPAIRIHSTPGTVLRITAGELLNQDGTVSQASSGGPQWWTYTARGDASETWHPLFSYYGFRYLQLQWIRGSGTIQSLQGISLHSSSQPVGTFSSSSELLNRIHALILAAVHNNEESIFTDCPHREKLGWLEETHLVAPTLLFNDDVTALYRATARNISDAQQPSGVVPTITPQYTTFGPKYAVYDDSPEWGSASILGPWWVFRMTGDTRLLEQQYGAMQHYLRYLRSRGTDGIVSYGLGDWYDIGPKPPGFGQETTLGLTATLMLVEDSQVMARIATLLGKQSDAAAYSALATEVAGAFQSRFYLASNGMYDTGSQAANSMPLALGIVPKADEGAVLSRIVSDIERHHDHITTGEVSYPYLMHALLEHGRSDVILAMLLRTDAPGYGSQLAAGATALTEAWDANPHNSQDHFMLGAADEWFYRGLAGIDIDFSRAAPSERLTLRPEILPGITYAHASYETSFGTIAIKWQKSGPRLVVDATVPPGTTATLRLPVLFGTSVDEGRIRASRAKGVTVISTEENMAIFKLDSGSYHFTSTLPDGK